MRRALASMVVVALAALAGALAIWAAWVWTVLRWYRLREQRPAVLRAVCADGWELAVYFRPAVERRYAEPVLLCHGIAANHYNFDFDPPYSVAHALSQAGFDCYTVEWRGTGGSRRPPRGKRSRDICVDDHIALDAPALLALALEHSQASSAFWLGHSMGALVGYAFAGAPERPRLKGLMALAAPVFFRYSGLLRYAALLSPLAAWPFGFRQRWVSVSLAPFLGYVALPFTDVIANLRSIAPAVQRRVTAHLVSSVTLKLLRQFRDWISHDVFRSYDGREDYRARIARIGCPTLVMGGAGDQLAPPENLRAQFDLLTAKEKTLMIFGRENGDAADYGHGDLIFSERAPVEVYPAFVKWLTAHATPIQRSTQGESVQG